MPLLRHMHNAAAGRADAGVAAGAQGPSDALVLDLADLQRTAELLRERAQERANRIIAEAEEQRRTLLAETERSAKRRGESQGRRAGLERGAKEGREAAVAEHRERFGAVAAGWAAALAELEGERESLLTHAREDVLRLAVRLAERIVRRAIKVDDRAVRGPLEAALASCVGATRLTVRTHPDDAAVVRELMPGVLESLGSSAHADVFEDQTVGRGGVRLGLGGGAAIDASVEKQLTRIVRTLLPDEAVALETPSATPGDSEAVAEHDAVTDRSAARADNNTGKQAGKQAGKQTGKQTGPGAEKKAKPGAERQPGRSAKPSAAASDEDAADRTRQARAEAKRRRQQNAAGRTASPSRDASRSDAGSADRPAASRVADEPAATAGRVPPEQTDRADRPRRDAA